MKSGIRKMKRKLNFIFLIPDFWFINSLKQFILSILEIFQTLLPLVRHHFVKKNLKKTFELSCF